MAAFNNNNTSLKRLNQDKEKGHHADVTGIRWSVQGEQVPCPQSSELYEVEGNMALLPNSFGQWRRPHERNYLL